MWVTTRDGAREFLLFHEEPLPLTERGKGVLVYIDHIYSNNANHDKYDAEKPVGASRL